MDVKAPFVCFHCFVGMLVVRLFVMNFLSGPISRSPLLAVWHEHGDASQ